MSDLSMNRPASLVSDAAAATAPVVCAHIGWGMLEVTGDDALEFLHGQLSSDVQSLPPGRGQYWSYNSPKGRMLANGALWRADAEGSRRVLLLLAADLAEAIRRRLSMFVLRSRVLVQDVTNRDALLGVAGAGSIEAAREALGVQALPFAVKGFNGNANALGLPDGRVVVSCPSTNAPIIHAALARHAITGNAELWRWFGIAAGVPSITAATSDMFIPQAANWDVLDGINFQKGCYPGQEIIARTQYLGRLKERLFAFHTDVEAVHAAARLYSASFGNDQPCGTVVDAAPASTGGSDLLAVVQQSAVDADDVRLEMPDGAPLARRPLPYTVPKASAPRRPDKL